MNNIKQLAIESIATGYNPRKVLNGKDELKSSIEHEGRLLDPITVRPDGDRYIIIDGHRRFTVVAELGWTEIDCIVEEVDEKTAVHLSFIKNTKREDINPIDRANHIRMMREKYGYTNREFVSLGYGKSVSTIKNYLSLLMLHPEVQSRISNGEIFPSVGYELAKLDDHETQKRLSDEIPSWKRSWKDKVKKKVNHIITKKNHAKVVPVVPIPKGDIPGVFFKDARDMSELPDGSVHLIVTSLPYNVGLEYEEGVSFEDHLKNVDGILTECARVLVPGGKLILNFGDIHNFGTRNGGEPEIQLVGHHYQDMLRKHAIRLRDEVTWEKNPNWVNNPQVSYSDRIQHTEYRFLNNTEYIFLFKKDGQRNVSIDLEYESKIDKDQWKTFVNGIWKINAVASQNGHPAQFPEELVRRLIEMYSYINDVVLDPCLGSGTTVKVAQELGRTGIGYEKEEKYKPIIMKKLGIEILEETATVASPLDGLVDGITELTRSLEEQGKDLDQIKNLTVPYIEDKGRYVQPVVDGDGEDPDDDPDDDPDNDGTGGDSPRPSFTNDNFAVIGGELSGFHDSTTCSGIIAPTCWATQSSLPAVITRQGVLENTIVNGDCFKVIEEIQDKSVDLVFTSPPYADVKDYGRQVSVPRPDHYVDWFLPLFDQFHRILKPTGSLVINIGGKVVKKRRHPFIHELIVRACRETRMEFYDEYIWSKRGTMPNGSNKRLNTTTEYLLHFCKNPDKTKWNLDAVREEYARQTLKRFDYAICEFTTTVDESGNRQKRGKKKVEPNPNGKRPSNVFYFPTTSSVRGNGHPAAFHEDMPAWFIKALTDEGDMILDPFAGSGTTCLAANKLGRRYIGIELNKEYWDYAAKRVEGNKNVVIH